MTSPQILLYLLEESRKYEYKDIKLCRGSEEWLTLSGFKATHFIHVANYRDQKGELCEGIILKLEEVSSLKFETCYNNGIEQILTIDSLTIIYNLFTKNLYLCYGI